MTVPLWDSLTDGQKSTLLYSPNPSVGVGVELLNFDLTVAQDLTPWVDVTGGDVEWQAKTLVSRSVQINLSTQLQWGTAMIRVYRIVTDQITGLSCRVDRGVFCLTTPEQPLGQTVTINGAAQVVYSVTGQDRSSLLDRLPGYSVVEPKLDGSGNPRTVGMVLADLYAQAGMPAGTYLIDSSAASTPLPRDMVWPLVSTGATDTSSAQSDSSVDPAITAEGSSGSATWRTMIDDVHSLTSYRAVWCDSHGYLRSTPYALPALSPVKLSIGGAGLPAPIGVDRKLTVDPWGVPNRWLFIWSNMPNDGSGNQQTPTTANGGVYQVDNVSDGVSSQTQRNGLVYAQTFSFTAATASDLVTQGDAKVAADKRTATAYTFTVRPNWTVFGHFDVVTLNDPAVDGGAVKVQLTSWIESFQNDDIQVTAESV